MRCDPKEKSDMLRRFKAPTLILLFAFFAHGLAHAQTAAPATTSNAQSRVLGEVLKIDPNTKQLILKTAEGAQVTVECDEKTVYRRVPPGETTLDKATPISFTDINVGDRVIARGSTSEPGKALSARGVIVINRQEIARKKQHDRAEWTSRGIEGVVTAMKPETKEITLLTQSPEGPKSLTVAMTGSQIRRYAPDSIKYSDAKPSSINEMKVGDRLRALVNKSEDGSRLVAEEIVFGAIRTVGGFVTAVDLGRGEIKINDIPSKQLLTIVVNNDSMLRRLSPEVSRLLSTDQKGTVQQMVEQQPPLALAELKVGDGILASTTVGTGSSFVNAIILVAGVESFLKQHTQQSKGRDFNVSLALPSGVAP
jgi:hypothetical protein